MMQHCCGSQGMVGPCSCGVFHTQQSTSFSMIFNQTPSFDHHMYHQYAPSPSVDCTLSLATPSTRMSSDHDHARRRPSYFCWDVLHPKPSPPHSHNNNNKTTTARSSSSAAYNNNNDALLARRCANCDTTSTPLWRNGPRGPKSLCNACGIRYKKEERRATAAASGGGAAEHQTFNNPSWAHQTQKVACYSPAGNEYRFMDDADNRDSFLSWRLNVTDRPGLVHDFTR